MSLVIRAAIIQDAEALAAFGQKTFFDTFGHLYPVEDAETFVAERFSRERTLQDLAEPGRFVQLAFLDGALVGFLDCGAISLPLAAPKMPCRELYRLYLDLSVQGTGLAQILMQKVIDWAKGEGAMALYLGVYHDNARAQAFYRKFGFEIVGQYFFKVGNTLDDERIMELILS